VNDARGVSSKTSEQLNIANEAATAAAPSSFILRFFIVLSD
jgi:hypothetical protein